MTTTAVQYETIIGLEVHAQLLTRSTPGGNGVLCLSAGGANPLQLSAVVTPDMQREAAEALDAVLP